MALFQHEISLFQKLHLQTEVEQCLAHTGNVREITNQSFLKYSIMHSCLILVFPNILQSIHVPFLIYGYVKHHSQANYIYFILHCFLQATEWAPDEDTKRSCQSKGKSEVLCSVI